MRIWSIITTLLLAGLGACGNLRVSDDCECGFYTVEGTERMLHWKDGTNVAFRLDSRLPDSYKLAMHQVSNEYNRVMSKTRVQIEETRGENGQVTSAPKAPAYDPANPRGVSGDGINGIYWVTEKWPWESSDPDSDAMTVLIFDPKGIIEADIYFKARNFAAPTMSIAKAQDLYHPATGFNVAEADRGTQWVYVLGLHEMGHALGRVHSHDQASMMYKSVGLEFVDQSFRVDDLKILSNVYTLTAGVIEALERKTPAPQAPAETPESTDPLIVGDLE